MIVAENKSVKEITKKKIAILSDSIYPFNKGGKEKRIYEITTRLASEGHDVTIYCMHWWRGERIIVKNGVTFHAIGSHHDLYAGNRRSITEAIFFAINSFKLLTKKFDVIDIDHMPQLVIFSTKIVCFLKRKQMIVTWHEVWGRVYWKKYLGNFLGEIGFIVEKVSANIPDTMISVSDHTTKNLKNMLGRKKEIVVIPNGVDIETIMEELPSDNLSDIIFAGRLLQNKNIDVLLRAVAILKTKKPDIKLFIIGDGPEKQNLESLASVLKIEKNVNFFGFFEDNNKVYGLMKSSKVFVLPSTREGFGIVALEANACGIPVITTNHEQNATKELIKEGENGVLTELDEEQIAEAIENLLINKKNQIFYRKYVEKYNWDNVVMGIKNTYSI
jgi:glycosyltransferase involved in cell wall biosynthesis